MAKFTTAIVGVLVLYSGLTTVILDLEVGDTCVEKISNKTGVCSFESSCQNPIDDLKVKGRQASCGYKDKEPVVCCNPPAKKTISELKCEEYQKPVTSTVSFIALLPDAEAVDLTSANCTLDKSQLVVGGVAALPGQFPHMAAIGWSSTRGGYEFKCGGTLISERFVLTAGHCLATSSQDSEVTSLEPTLIRLGDLDLRPGEFDGAEPFDANIKRIMKHPEYRPPQTYNDIALLEMENKVEFTTFVRPACLWQKNDFAGLNSGVVTGWGAIASMANRSDVLLMVTLDLFSNEQCQPLLQRLRSRKWKEGFRDTQLCAGDLEGGHDSCQGDSGGPLQVTLDGNHCVYYVMGITSFGYDCGKVNGPGVYTRVSSFVPWIESIVWPGQ